MEPWKEIENKLAAKYHADTTTTKAIGDFMLTADHAVNVKSNNVAKQNYSPNIISIKKMHEWVFEKRKDLSFIFVDYEIAAGTIAVLAESDLIPIEEIGWDCLSIEAQGYGVIQKNRPLLVVPGLSKRDFYEGFLEAYEKYRLKERLKHEKFSQRFIDDLDTIDW